MNYTRRVVLKAAGATGAAGILSGTAHGAETTVRSNSMQDDSNDTEPAEAALRAAHFAPDASAVDVYLDRNQVLSDLAYGELSEYLPVDPGTYEIIVTEAGESDEILFEGEETIGSAFYTVVARGESEDDPLEPLLVLDAKAALVRLLHTSPDAPTIDLRAVEADPDDRPLLTDVSTGDVTAYVPIPEGQYSFEIIPTDDDDAVVTADVDLEAGVSYNLAAIGYLDPPDEFSDRGLTLVVSENDPNGVES